MNHCLEIIENRYSCRSFSDREIEQEVLDRILRACQVAPTAANKQPQRVIVLKSPEALEKAKTVTRYTFHAPVILLICAQMDEAWVGVDGHNAGPTDAAIATTQMMLAAFEEGIGSCWVRGFDKNAVAEIFELPDNLEPVAMLPIGYPDEKGLKVPAWHYKREEIGHFVEYR